MKRKLLVIGLLMVVVLVCGGCVECERKVEMEGIVADIEFYDVLVRVRFEDGTRCVINPTTNSDARRILRDAWEGDYLCLWLCDYKGELWLRDAVVLPEHLLRKDETPSS